MKKKLMLLVTILLSAALLVGCGSNNNGNNEGNGSESKLTGSLEDIMVELQEALNGDIMTFNETLDLKDSDALKYNLGLNDSKGIKEALVSNAMISTQAYATALVRVDEDADAQEIAKNIAVGVDERKWICVGADDVQVAVYGDLIYLVMLDSTLSEKSVQEHFEAFEDIAGEHVDTIIKK